MGRRKIQKGCVFVASISYFLKNIPKEEIMPDFLKSIFQTRHMVCGFIEEERYTHDDYFLVTLKRAKGYYGLLGDIAVSYNADLSKLHIVKNIQCTNLLEFEAIPKDKIVRIIKDKDYD